MQTTMLLIIGFIGGVVVDRFFLEEKIQSLESDRDQFKKDKFAALEESHVLRDRMLRLLKKEEINDKNE